MSSMLYSIIPEIERNLKNLSFNEFLAKSTILIDSTLDSIGRGYGDHDIHREVRIVIKDRSKWALTRLALISYYIPKNFGVLLRLALLEQVQNNIDLNEVRFILTSKGYMLNWLREYSETHNAHQIFGNLLNKSEYSEEFFKNSLKITTRRNHRLPTDPRPKPKRFIGVGYKDKGTLPKSHELKYQWFSSFQEVEKQLENQFQRDSSYGLMEGFLW